MDRRNFLTSGTSAAVLASLAGEAFAQSKSPPPQKNWTRVRSVMLSLVRSVWYARNCERILHDAPSEDKGIRLDELNVLESVAQEIMNSRDERGRTMMETDRLLWLRAKEVTDLGAKFPLRIGILPRRSRSTGRRQKLLARSHSATHRRRAEEPGETCGQVGLRPGS